MYLSTTQVLTGGIPGTKETRILDWRPTEHSDHIFGDAIIRSEIINGVEGEAGVVAPDLQLQTRIVCEQKKGEIEMFLKGCHANIANRQLDGLYIHDFISSQQQGWTAEQVRLFPNLYPG